MHLPRFMRSVNRVFTNPVMGTVAWLVPPLAVVHHVGRKSGRRYNSPVVAFHTATRFVIPMTYGRDVDWARNIVKAGGCEVVQMGRTYPLRKPRIVDGKTAYPHLPVIVRDALRAANLPGYVILERAHHDPAPSQRRSR